MQHGLVFELITDDAAFDALQSEWDDLLSRSSADPLFCGFVWMRAWWRHFGDRFGLRILTARENGALVGIAPLYLAKRSARDLEQALIGEVRVLWSAEGGDVRVLSPIGYDEPVCADLLSMIAPTDRVDEITTALYGACRTVIDDYDVFYWPYIEEASLGYQALKDSVSRSRHWREGESARAPYASLPGDYEAYLNTLSKKSRYNARKKIKQIRVYHELEHKFHDDPATLQSAFDIFLALHKERWEAEGQGGAFEDPAMEALHRDFAAQALERGWLRLGMMSLDGRIVFSTYGFMIGDRYYLYQQGGTTDFAQFNLGYAALTFCLEDACENGATSFEFLRGEADYKLHWAKERRHLSYLMAGRTLAATRFFVRSFINTDPRVRNTVKKIIGRGQV